MLAAADGFGWGQPRPTLPPDYRRVAAIGNPRPRIMTLIDDLLSTANTPGFGSQQYRAVSAIAHAAPHAIGLMGDGSDPPTAREIAQRHLPMLAFALVGAILLAGNHTISDDQPLPGRLSGSVFHGGWSPGTIAARDRGFGEALPALIGTLESHGLIQALRSSTPYQSSTAAYSITAAGNQLLQRLAEDGAA
jgi:hypothetical protein